MFMALTPAFSFSMSFVNSRDRSDAAALAVVIKTMQKSDASAVFGTAPKGTSFMDLLKMRQQNTQRATPTAPVVSGESKLAHALQTVEEDITLTEDNQEHQEVLFEELPVNNTPPTLTRQTATFYEPSDETRKVLEAHAQGVNLPRQLAFEDLAGLERKELDEETLERIRLIALGSSNSSLND